MGNKQQSTKHQILDILRKSPQGAGGEYLASKLNLSRTSIWKAVRSLEENGYEIRSAHGGYTLVKDLSDSLCSFEFDEYEDIIIYQNSVSSTMDLARNIALKGNLDRIKIITTDFQTSAKAYSNNEWQTTNGSLACTLVTPAKVDCSKLSRLVQAVELCVCKLLESLLSQRFFIKLPNEIYSRSGKIGGVYDEAFVCAGVTQWVNLGLGLNLGETPSIKGSASIKTGLTRKDFLKRFYEDFLVWYERALDSDFNMTQLLNSYRLSKI